MVPPIQSDRIVHNNKEYRIISQIAYGGMGEILLTQDLNNGQLLALKHFFMHAYGCQANCEKYWLREQEILRIQSESPVRSVQYIDAFSTINARNQAEYYILMEYIQGITLEKWVELHPIIANIEEIDERLKKFIIPLCKHLSYVHSKGIIHRDITPRNIMVVTENGAEIPVLIDWGVAKLNSFEKIDRPFAQTSATVISSFGNPPEILAGIEPVIGSDIYMMGAVVFYLLTCGQIVRPLREIDYVLDLSVFVPYIPEHIKRLVRQMTQFESASRLQSMEQVIDGLQENSKGLLKSESPELIAPEHRDLPLKSTYLGSNTFAAHQTNNATTFQTSVKNKPDYSEMLYKFHKKALKSIWAYNYMFDSDYLDLDTFYEEYQTDDEEELDITKEQFLFYIKILLKYGYLYGKKENGQLTIHIDGNNIGAIKQNLSKKWNLDEILRSIKIEKKEDLPNFEFDVNDEMAESEDGSKDVMYKGVKILIKDLAVLQKLKKIYKYKFHLDTSENFDSEINDISFDSEDDYTSNNKFVIRDKRVVYFEIAFNRYYDFERDEPYKPEELGNDDEYENRPYEEIPELISQLTGLQKLILKAFKNNLPEWIGNLTNLKELYLNENHFENLPDSIGNLVNLETFYAQGNRLTELPDSFSQLKNLKVLNLGNNNLTRFPPSIAKLSSLEKLHLSYNVIENFPPNLIQLRNLKYFHFDFSHLIENTKDYKDTVTIIKQNRSEERRGGKECRSRW